MSEQENTTAENFQVIFASTDSSGHETLFRDPAVYFKDQGEAEAYADAQLAAQRYGKAVHTAFVCRVHSAFGKRVVVHKFL